MLQAFQRWLKTYYKANGAKVFWEKGTSRYENQTEDKVVQSIVHSDDKQQQLQRDANATSLVPFLNSGAAVFGGSSSLQQLRSDAESVFWSLPPPSIPYASSHRSRDAAFAPAQVHKAKRFDPRLRAASHGLP